MVTHCCDEMATHLRDGVGIIYTPKFREYGIVYLDGGTSIQVISCCPWCGNNLPESLRSTWFDMIEKLGLDPDDPSIPQAFLSEQWWLKGDE